MKQFLSTFIVLLTFLLPSVVWGSVEGKGIICEDKEGWSNRKFQGYLFKKENKVGSYSLLLKNNQYKVHHGIDFINVSIGKHEIRWEWLHDGSGFNTPKQILDRRTLELSSYWWGKYYKRFCKVYDSPKKFFSEMEKLKLHLQSKYDEELKENKI